MPATSCEYHNFSQGGSLLTIFLPFQGGTVASDCWLSTQDCGAHGTLSPANCR